MPKRTAFVDISSENTIIEFTVALSIGPKIKHWIEQTFPATEESYYFDRLKVADDVASHLTHRFILPSFDVGRFVANLHLFCEKSGYAFNDKRSK